jgi:Flavin containing amine oxidoreductase
MDQQAYLSTWALHGSMARAETRSMNYFKDLKQQLFKSKFHSTTIYFDGARVNDNNIIGDFYTYIHERKRKSNSDESLSTTLDNYIRKREINDFRETVYRHLLSTCMETEYGTNMFDLSLRWFGEDEEYAGGDIFVGSGYDEIVKELGQGAACCLNSPVTEISDIGSEVVVSAVGTKYIAHHAVVTVSLGVLQRHAIIFSPPLSNKKHRALKHLGMGNLHKVYLEFPSAFWDDTQIIHIVMRDGGGREFINLTKEMGSPVLLALHGGTLASTIDSMSDEQIGHEIFAVLRSVYPGATKPIKITSSTWERHPFTLGSYSFVKVGGSLEMYGDLAKPEGRIHFAGEHTSESFPGTVHGAMRSGYRAARSIASLRKAWINDAANSSFS